MCILDLVGLSERGSHRMRERGEPHLRERTKSRDEGVPLFGIDMGREQEVIKILNFDWLSKAQTMTSTRKNEMSANLHAPPPTPLFCPEATTTAHGIVVSHLLLLLCSDNCRATRMPPQSSNAGAETSTMRRVDSETSLASEAGDNRNASEYKVRKSKLIG